MDMEKILEGFFQKFDPINRNTGRIYDENTYREQVRKLEIEIKVKNRMRKIENILSNLK